MGDPLSMLLLEVGEVKVKITLFALLVVTCMLGKADTIAVRISFLLE